MDSPKVKYQWSRIKFSRDSWVQTRTYRTLLRSTGHPIQDGHRVGSDDFHVFVDVEKPGLGVYGRHATLGPMTLDYADIDAITFAWRPVLTRDYSSTEYYVNEFGWHSYLSEQDLPEPDVPSMNDFILDLNDKGTSFIRRARPGNPVAGLGQFIGELHEIPEIPVFQSRSRYFATLGSSFLAFEFGWKPFLKDLKKAYKLTLTLDQRLQALIAGNGLKLKRTRSTESPTETSTIATGTRNAPFVDLSVDDDGEPTGLDGFVVAGPFGHSFRGDSNPITGSLKWKLEEIVNRVDWFTGTFSYYCPDIGTLEWKDRARLALYEANLTPSILYEIYPWSWLADWFANVGDIVSNLSTNAVDNEALERCFVMSRQSTERRLTVSVQWDEYNVPDEGNGAFFVPAGSDELVWTHVRLNKFRHPASPFGFGITSSDFTTRQKVILAALGLTGRGNPIRSLKKLRQLF